VGGRKKVFVLELDSSSTSLTLSDRVMRPTQVFKDLSKQGNSEEILQADFLAELE